MIRIRCFIVAAGASATLAMVWRGLGGAVTAPAVDPVSALTRLFTAALLLALLWGWVAVLAAVVDAWRQADRGCGAPACRPIGRVRRAVLAACGVAVTGVVVAPVSHATPAPVDTTAHVARAAAHPGVAAAAHPPLPVRVVHRGDCLWSIAASEVQPGAGPATIAARWRAVYAANHGVIGDDPDLIRPGQHLRMPR